MEADKKIQVLIVDDHQIVRDGLKMFLSVQEDMELAGEAGDGEQAVIQCAQVNPDVVLMDLVMPRKDGPAATAEIREQFPEIKVLALTSYAEEGLVHQALEAGAIGYVLKDINSEKLAEAVRGAYQGQVTLGPAAARILVESTGSANKLGDDLTERELQVLQFIVEGKTNQEIAEALIISIGTVRFHVSNILSKLAANNRTEAARLAGKYGLVS